MKTKNKNLIKQNKNYQGFSLLEMMISMFIFVLAIVTAVSIFSGVASTRQNSREIQKNMEDVRTALDLMAKNMRMSIGLVDDGTDQRIYMFNTSQNSCVSYMFSGSKLQMSQVFPTSSLPEDEKCLPANISYGSYQDIIQSDVSGSFEIIPTSITSPKTVGKATIILTIDGVNMQTSVSFRDYNNIVQ